MAQSYQPVADPRLFELKALQSARLRATYADFAAQPQNEAACFFFFNRLYTTEDTNERDAAFRKVHGLVNRWLGGEVVRSMEKLIELQEITLTMDHAMMDQLNQMEAPHPYAMGDYERGYALCDNYDKRQTQIVLLDYTMRLVYRISHRMGIGMVLSALHAASLMAGETRLVDFLMDGYKAFKHLRKIEPLAEAMVFRETERLNRIFGKPFKENW